jgi:hypothetical protein
MVPGTAMFFTPCDERRKVINFAAAAVKGVTYV